MARDDNAAGSSPEREPLLNTRVSASAFKDRGVHDSEDNEEVVVIQEYSTGTLALILGTAWVGVFLGAMDATIMATLAAPVSNEFKSLNLLSWLATAYLMSSAVCLPITGRLTDIFGRGPGLILSNALFATGNLMCAMATDEYIMLFGRVIAGFGGGGMRSIANFLASDLVPLRSRGLVQGIANFCYGSGAMLGGVLGGLLNDHTALGWRLAFLIQVPPTLLSAIAALVFIRIPPKQSDKSYLKRIDFFGVLLSCLFVILLLLGLNCGGNLVPWTHPLPIVTIPLSSFIFIAFLWWENKVKQPIIPVQLLANRTILGACLTNFLCDMLVMAAIYYVPLYLQVIGNSATIAGREMLPWPAGDALGAIGAGYIMKWTGHYSGLRVPSLLAIITGAVLFAFQTKASQAWITSAAFFFVGGGYGAMLTITQVACIAAVDQSQQAVIMSAIYFIRSIGSTLGVTSASVIFQNTLQGKLWNQFGDRAHAAETIRHIRDSLSELNHLPAGWYDGVIESYIGAFRIVWFMMIGWAVLGLLCISLMKQYKLHSTLTRD